MRHRDSASRVNSWWPCGTGAGTRNGWDPGDRKFRQKMGRPVVWFHSVTGFKQVFNEPALRELEKLQDRELDFLERAAG